MRVETRYAAVGLDDVAYQVVGDGPLNFLCFYGLGSQIDLTWDIPPVLVERFAPFFRTIQFDRRGTGASDALPRDRFPTWEEWTRDIAAVLDAAECGDAAIYAEVDAAPIALLYAATHPERVRALVLSNATARYLAADDYLIGFSQSQVDFMLGFIESLWGTDEWVEQIFPSVAHNAAFVRKCARMFRAAATPRTAAAQFRYIFENLDVRDVLPLVRVPTLLLHNVPNRVYPIAQARYIADRINGARLVEVPGEGDINVMGESGMAIVDEVVEFLTGERPAIEIDRVLTTVVFTDIVGSTEQLAAMGDRRWRAILDSHDDAMRELLRRFGGREIKTTGDGFFASFDGPARAIRCVNEIVDTAAHLGVKLRAGLHSGECEVRGNDLGGIAVHIAARVGALAGAGEILVTSTVKDLVAGSDIRFDDRGPHALKGIPDEWRLLSVESA
jgi:class 3 adenylate cyclase